MEPAPAPVALPAASQHTTGNTTPNNTATPPQIQEVHDKGLEALRATALGLHGPLRKVAKIHTCDPEGIEARYAQTLAAVQKDFQKEFARSKDVKQALLRADLTPYEYLLENYYLLWKLDAGYLREEITQYLSKQLQNFAFDADASERDKLNAFKAFLQVFKLLSPVQRVARDSDLGVVLNELLDSKDLLNVLNTIKQNLSQDCPLSRANTSILFQYIPNQQGHVAELLCSLTRKGLLSCPPMPLEDATPREQHEVNFIFKWMGHIDPKIFAAGTGVVEILKHLNISVHLVYEALVKKLEHPVLPICIGIFLQSADLTVPEMQVLLVSYFRQNPNEIKNYLRALVVPVAEMPETWRSLITHEKYGISDDNELPLILFNLVRELEPPAALITDETYAAFFEYFASVTRTPYTYGLFSTVILAKQSQILSKLDLYKPHVIFTLLSINPADLTSNEQAFVQACMPTMDWTKIPDVHLFIRHFETYATWLFAAMAKVPEELYLFACARFPRLMQISRAYDRALYGNLVHNLLQKWKKEDGSLSLTKLIDDLVQSEPKERKTKIIFAHSMVTHHNIEFKTDFIGEVQPATWALFDHFDCTLILSLINDVPLLVQMSKQRLISLGEQDHLNRVFLYAHIPHQKIKQHVSAGTVSSADYEALLAPKTLTLAEIFTAPPPQELSHPTTIHTLALFNAKFPRHKTPAHLARFIHENKKRLYVLNDPTGQTLGDLQSLEEPPGKI